MSGRAGAPPSAGTRPVTAPQQTAAGRAGLPPGPVSLERELEGIRHLVVLMGGEVDRSITRAVGGLVDREVAVCTSVILEAARLDRLQDELRRLCRSTVLDRDPPAEHLREAVALLHMAAQLVRMGDHCAGVAGIGRDLARLPEPGGEISLTRIAECCGERVRAVIAAVGARDVRRARRLAIRDDRLERLGRELVEELAQTVRASRPATVRAARLVAVSHLLERIADRAATIAGDLVLLDGSAIGLPGRATA
jgi:phosphate transport system protein